MTEWYVLRDNNPIGPFDLPTMQRRLAAGELDARTLVCRVGAGEWSPLGQDDAFRTLGAPPPPPPPRPQFAPKPTYGGRQRSGDIGWDVWATAKYHRFLLLCLLFMLVSYFATVATTVAAPTGAASFIPGLFYLGSALASVVFGCLTLSAMRKPLPVIILFGVLLVIPCISLITLVVLSQMVLARMRSVRVPVGFFGVRRADLEAAGFRPST